MCGYSWVTNVQTEHTEWSCEFLSCVWTWAVYGHGFISHTVFVCACVCRCVECRCFSVPLEQTAGSWKQRLFPLPVGITRKTSLPDIVRLMALSCIGLNLERLNDFFSSCSTALDHGKSNKHEESWRGQRTNLVRLIPVLKPKLVHIQVCKHG